MENEWRKFRGVPLQQLVPQGHKDRVTTLGKSRGPRRATRRPHRTPAEVPENPLRGEFPRRAPRRVVPLAWWTLRNFKSLACTPKLPGEGGDHFHCAVEPLPGHIRCRVCCRCSQGDDVHMTLAWQERSCP